MKNPQLENGFIRISTELFDALCGIRISGEARQCLDVIIRKTYGFQKKEDKISLSQFCALSKMTRVAVCKSLLKLREMNLIITKKGNENITSYRFNKDFDAWKPLPKKVIIQKLLPKKEIGITKKGNNPLPKMVHTIDTVKDTITKDNIQQPAVAENDILNIFYKINPTLNFGNTTQRKSAISLIKKFGKEKVLKMAEAAVNCFGKQFAPVITNPYELEKNLSKLIAYYKREENKILTTKNYDK